MPVTSDGVGGSGAYAGAMANEGADAAWIRRVALLLVGQAFSLLGSSIVQYAIWWWIVLQTRTGSAMLLATLFGLSPQDLGCVITRLPSASRISTSREVSSDCMINRFWDIINKKWKISSAT